MSEGPLVWSLRPFRCALASLASPADPPSVCSHPLCDPAILMNPKHFHTPVSTRVRCPVCHEAVYSRAGIHPQCAVRQADPPKPKAKPPGVPRIDPVAPEIVDDPPIVV
jgi:hypothetical protein